MTSNDSTEREWGVEVTVTIPTYGKLSQVEDLVGTFLNEARLQFGARVEPVQAICWPWRDRYGDLSAGGIWNKLEIEAMSERVAR